ncbi:helix-turn-helix domain-containing protein [Variovorax ginsengisoli]|uniref:AraC-like DNA-binding protein n=1 Tax=Variovorax ginsengisoli TaxID=363844 RepID=A0ABT9SBM4_9BURK|nr:helix-turn-helix domain-containing protein [Variovorax ginsengisoli]MDP9900757.1 AraC-like DNA-binding protein [Variovorax ginsengisoli]
MQTWTTDHLAEKDKFSYWRDVLCQAYVALDPRTADDHNFGGRVSAHLLSTINVTTIASSRQEIYRGAAEIRKMPVEVYFLNLQVRGQCRMNQGGRSVLLQPGEFSLVDSTQPYLNDYCSDDWEQYSFRIPHHLLRPLLQDPEQKTAQRVHDDGGLGTIAIDFLKSIAQRASVFPEAAAAKLGESLIDLVALSLGGTAAAQESGQQNVKRNFCVTLAKHIELNAADATLSPAKVAQHFHISPRYLHKILEEGGRSFGRILLESRLEHCAKDLRQSGATGSISQIAYRWGFNDLSHFSRTFRARFGHSPREFRLCAIG